MAGRARVHALLAREAEASLLGETPNNISLPSNEEPAAEGESSIHEMPSLESNFLPIELPPAFFGGQSTNNFYNIKRKQRQRMAAMAAHEEKAIQYLRDIRNKTKLLHLLKEYGNPQETKNLEIIIEELSDKANYHKVMAREIHAQVYHHDSNAPGAHKVVAHGNYELEFPVRPPSPTRKAREIKNPKEDLIRLQKTRAVPLASAKLAPNKKLSAAKQQQLPVAKKITAKAVTATLPKNITLSEAKASIV